jgi:hypothetical protein
VASVLDRARTGPGVIPGVPHDPPKAAIRDCFGPTKPEGLRAITPKRATLLYSAASPTML